MKYISILLITVSTLFSFQPTDPEDEGWKHEKSKNGIHVYSRIVEGAAIKEARMVLTIEARLSSVVAILEDVDSYPEWAYRTATAEVVETDHQGRMTFYTVGDFPWPLSDRDAVVTSHLYQDKETGIVYTKTSCAEGVKPVVKDLIRVDLMDSYGIIESQGNGIVKIDYRVRTDPGGNIPVWLINMFFDKGPVYNFENMREYIKKPKYRDAELSYVDDDLH